MIKSLRARASASAVAPFAAVAVAMVSVQFGAAFAKQLFPAVGAEGTTALRVSLAALMLAAVLRPWRRPPPRGAWPALMGYGLALGAMNLMFYLALRTVPLGVAVGLEFTGPLAVAMLSSRRWIDFLWIALAVLGLAALLPLGHADRTLDPAGAALALGAGACWAAYIVLGKRAGATGPGQALAIGAAFASLITLPFGLVHAGSGLFAPPIFLTACLVALLSSVVPYSLEMFALSRMPARVFGTLMSAEPAVAALMGLLLLHERLSVRQGLAVVAIIAASVGVALTARPASNPPPAA